MSLKISKLLIIIKNTSHTWNAEWLSKCMERRTPSDLPRCDISNYETKLEQKIINL